MVGWMDGWTQARKGGEKPIKACAFRETEFAGQFGTMTLRVATAALVVASTAATPVVVLATML